MKVKFVKQETPEVVVDTSLLGLFRKFTTDNDMYINKSEDGFREYAINILPNRVKIKVEAVFQKRMEIFEIEKVIIEAFMPNHIYSTGLWKIFPSGNQSHVEIWNEAMAEIDEYKNTRINHLFYIIGKSEHNIYTTELEKCSDIITIIEQSKPKNKKVHTEVCTYVYMDISTKKVLGKNTVDIDFSVFEKLFAKYKRSGK